MGLTSLISSLLRLPGRGTSEPKLADLLDALSGLSPRADMERLPAAVLDAFEAVLSWGEAAVLEIDPRTGALSLVAFRGGDEHAWRNAAQNLSSDRRLAAAAMPFPFGPDGRGEGLCVPLPGPDRPIGALLARPLPARPPSDRAIAAARALAAAAGLAWSAARSSAAARIDARTGLATPAFLRARLEEEIERARRHLLYLSVLWLRLDDAADSPGGGPPANGADGRPEEGRLLVHAARILQAALRAFDVCSNEGGGEFAVLLPSTDSPSAWLLAQRVESLLKDTPFRTGAGSRALGASIGVASFSPVKPLDAAALLAKAREASASARAGGGDRIVGAAGD